MPVPMNQCIVPAADWDLRHQRQEQNETEQEQPKIKRFSHMHTHFQNSSIPNLGPMSNYEVAKLTWENGQLAMHGLGGLHHSGPTKPTWGRTNETLESIVDQAMCHNHNLINAYQDDHQANPANKRTLGASSGRKLSGTSSDCSAQSEPSSAKKRAWSELNQYPKRLDDRNLDEHASGCASASATFCRDNDSTTMTWASFDSLPILKTKSTDEDSACHDGSENQDEDRETKTEITVRSHSSRKSRSAAVHNLSERRRRDRINQKMKALQKLVPNASKTDKASMLDEVIDYLKQLQAQNQLMMSMRNSTPHIMTPVGMQQQHLQMCLLAARMGMGAGQRMPGMGMLDMSALTRGAAQSLAAFMHPAVAAQNVVASAPPFLPPHLLVPPMVPAHGPLQPNQVPAAGCFVPLPDPRRSLLAQSMNIDLYNKMAALYRQRVNHATSSPSQSNHVQSD